MVQTHIEGFESIEKRRAIESNQTQQMKLHSHIMRSFFAKELHTFRKKYRNTEFIHKMNKKGSKTLSLKVLIVFLTVGVSNNTFKYP